MRSILELAAPHPFVPYITSGSAFDIVNTKAQIKASVYNWLEFGTDLNQAIDSWVINPLPVDLVGWYATLENFFMNFFFVSKRFDKHEFTYKIDKFFITTMLEEYANEAKPLTSHFFQDDPVDEQKYYRKNGELFTKDNDGNEIKLTAEWAAANLKFDDKCLGTGFVNHGSQTCADYLRNCLRGKDINKCKAYLQESNYWENAVKEVENMNPLIAVETILAFEFQIEEKYDNMAKRSIRSVRGVDKWLESLFEITKTDPSKLSHTEYEALAKNEKLKGYLRMIVNKINTNPAILNKDYSGPTDIQQNHMQPKYPQLSHYGIQSWVPTRGFMGHVDRLEVLVKNNHNYLRQRLFTGYPGIPMGLSPFNNFRYKLSIGGSIIDDLDDKLSDVNKQTSNIIAQHYIRLIERLKVQYNKDISENDNKNMMGLIDNMRRIENKLNQSILYTEKYVDLLQKYGEKDNTSVLSYDHLKQFVDVRNKYFQKNEKKQLDLISIIKSIAEKINNEIPTDVIETKPKILNAKDINLKSLF